MTKEEFVKKYGILTGNNLMSFIKGYDGFKYRRRIVKNIKNEINNKKHRLLVITGDRRRGKTITMIQLIKEMYDYENSIYVVGNKEFDMKEFCQELLKLRLTGELDPKHIFIDEITEFKNLENVKQLSDLVKYPNNQIIITGTWTQIFHYYQYNLLLGRITIYNIEPISVFDYYNLTNKDSRKFIENGGYIDNITMDIAFEDHLDNVNIYLTHYGEPYGISKESIQKFTFSIIKDGIIREGVNLNNYDMNIKKFGENVGMLRFMNSKLDKSIKRGSNDF